jgi:hypothetical protein
MKKVLSILALSLSSTAFAASVGLEYQNITGVNGAANQRAYELSVKENFSKNIAGDIKITDTVTDGTDKLSSRIEAGVTGQHKYGAFTPYTRLGLGQKFNNGSNFSYYSVEPGVKALIGNTGVTAKVAYRFRNAFDTVNNDTTQTLRAGIEYSVTQKDTIGIGYDRVRGDSEQNIVKINYSRSF